MRIGIFNPTLHAIGGGEYATIIMMNTLKKHGYEVIVSSNKKIDQRMVMRIYGRKVIADAHIVSPLYNIFRWNPNRSQFVYINALQMYVLRLNCDFLIDVFSGVILPWIDILYLQTLGRNFSIRSKREFFLLPYVNWLKSTESGDKIVLACSKFVAQNEEIKGISCDVLYPPVGVDFFEPKLKELDDPRENLVITVSRFSREKKLENVPRIAKLVNERVSFLIVGSAQSYADVYPIQKAIRELNVGERVKIMTNVPRDTLRKLLLSSKVYLHTREYEPFGITIAEAMSTGCIPIVPDSGGPREFVPENLRYEAIEEGAMKIERAIDQWSTKKMREIINSAKSFNEQKFSERFLRIVNKTIETKLKNEAHTPV